VTAADERTDELLRPWLDAVDADPSDPNPVCILRDRLHETGDERAAGMDWLIAEGKRPEPPLHKGLGEWPNMWNWWDAGIWRGRPTAAASPPEHSRLPTAAYDTLPAGHDRGNSPAALYLNAAAVVSTWLTGER
jgi:hypothetical protein